MMNKKLPWVCWDHPMAKVLKSYDMIASKHKWTCSMCGRKLKDGAEAKERK